MGTRDRDMILVVHGDDFTTLAQPDQLKWLEGQFRNRFDIKLRGILGPDLSDMKQVTVLNRMVTS